MLCANYTDKACCKQSLVKLVHDDASTHLFLSVLFDHRCCVTNF